MKNLRIFKTEEEYNQETFSDAAQAYNDADTEFSNYRRGKYQYDKGKGWNLK